MKPRILNLEMHIMGGSKQHISEMKNLFIIYIHTTLTTGSILVPSLVITSSVCLSTDSPTGQLRKPPLISAKPVAKALRILMNKTGSVCINVM
jgi:hypothetical protein